MADRDFLYLFTDSVSWQDGEELKRQVFYMAHRCKQGKEFCGEKWPETVVFNVEPYRAEVSNHEPTNVEGLFLVVRRVPIRFELDQERSPAFIIDRIIGHARDRKSLDEKTLALAIDASREYAAKHDLRFVDETEELCDW